MSDVRTVKLKFSDLVFLEDNPRTITREKLERLAERIKKDPTFFENRPCLVNFTDGKYICYAGFQRSHAAAKILKWKEVPCSVENDVPAELMRERAILDNTHDGEWNAHVLANWEFEVPELIDLGVPEFVFGEGSNALNSEKLEAQEDDYEIPDEIKTDIVPGDLFEIGPHRLLCGDSTTKEDVFKLMNGEKAELVFTDPPYGVNVKGGKGKSNIAGDLTQTAIPFSFEISVQYATKDIATFYFCGGEGNIGLYHKLFERFLAQMPRMLIWVKNGFVLKPNGYHNQYELIFHGYKAGAGGLSHWFAGRTEHEASDVWRVNRDAASTYEHPTQKPIELPSRAIRNSTKEGWLVFEPFTGSGSTLVAAHQLNRRCYGMEIDPKYCQVIIDRMLKLDPTLEIKRNGQPYTKTAI